MSACESPKIHRIYGFMDQPATVLVRITCPGGCGHYAVKAWCEQCYQGVMTSGRRWVCKGCGGDFNSVVKLQNVIKIGAA